jgi:hypothetical protein
VTGRRRIGPEERGVRDSLKLVTRVDPALAAQALATAREIDDGDLAGRDRIAGRTRIAQCIIQIREWSPSAASGDPTDAAGRAVEEQGKLYAVKP